MWMSASSKRTWPSEQRPARLLGKAPSRLRSRVVRLRENGSSVLLGVSSAEHSELRFSPGPHRLHLPTHTDRDLNQVSLGFFWLCGLPCWSDRKSTRLNSSHL